MLKSVWRIRFSRWFNRQLGGKPGMMLSSRAYVENRKQLEWMINFCFYVLRQEEDHCRNSLYLDLLMEKIMERCGLCDHTDDLYPFEVNLQCGNQVHACGELCYKCVRYLHFVVSKFPTLELQILPKEKENEN